MIRAWHFVSGDTLRDGTPWTVGETEHHDGELALCKRGLHASRCPLDALYYAPGNIVRGVECSGEVVEGDDKLVCTQRRVLWAYDAADVLRHFARLCALDVIDMWDAPDIVRRYLETGDEGLREEAHDTAANACYRWSRKRALNGFENNRSFHDSAMAAMQSAECYPVYAAHGASGAMIRALRFSDKHPVRKDLSSRLSDMLEEGSRAHGHDTHDD